MVDFFPVLVTVNVRHKHSHSLCYKSGVILGSILNEMFFCFFNNNLPFLSTVRSGPISGAMQCFSFLLHTWFTWSAHQQALLRPDNKTFIWIRCHGAEMVSNKVQILRWIDFSGLSTLLEYFYFWSLYLNTNMCTFYSLHLKTVSLLLLSILQYIMHVSL